MLLSGVDSLVTAYCSNYPLVKILRNRAFHMIFRIVLIAGFRDLTIT